MAREIERTGQDRAATSLSARGWLALGLILVGSALVRLITIARPFQDDAESWAAFNGVLARNYLRFGWAVSHGMPLLNAGRRAGSHPVFYADHSPLVPLLIVPVFHLFGVGEWQVRAPTVIATLLAIAAVLALLAREGAPRAAVFAAALFAAAPMTLYFGGMPDVLWMPLLPAVILALLAYLRFADTPGPGRFWWLCGSFAVAAASDWPAFYLIPVVSLDMAIRRMPRRWFWIAALAAFAAAVFAILYGYIVWATGSSWTWMIVLLSKHTGIGSGDTVALALWMRHMFAVNRDRHTLVLVTAAAAWLVACVLPSVRQRPGARAGLLLLAWGLIHVGIGHLGVYSDDWWSAPLTPGIAVAAALLLDLIAASLPPRAGTVAVAVAVALVVVFAIYTTGRVWTALHTDPDPQAAVLFGEAARAAAPGLADAALVAGQQDADVSNWFYADRALRFGVWTPADVDDLCAADTDDVMYEHTQAAARGASGIVVPLDSDADLSSVRQFLAVNFRKLTLAAPVAQRYEVFDLTAGAHPSAAPACGSGQ